MKRVRRATPDPLTEAVGILLRKGLHLEEPARSLSCLLVVCKSVRAVVLEWLTNDFVSDVSYGREQLPVPLRGLHQEGRSRLRVHSLLELLRFQYVVKPQYPVPFQQHALPAHAVASAMQQDSAVQLVRRGREVRVFLARDERKGWCVHAAEDIVRGTYVGEYTGDVISSQKMQRRFQMDSEHNNMNYVLVLREFVARPGADGSDDSGCGFRVVRTIVDATETGNFTRFINHSCGANLELTAVRVDSYIPRLVLFAQRAVKHGDELTFDYGGASGPISSSEDAPQCHCDATQCRGVLPYDASI